MRRTLETIWRYSTGLQSISQAHFSKQTKFNQVRFTPVKMENKSLSDIAYAK